MTYAEGVAARLREVFARGADVVETKTFGGLAFMVSDHMACAVVNVGFMVRVGAERYPAALARPVCE